MSEDGSETIFLAWQSDVGRPVTGKLKDVLETAAKALGQKHNVKLRIDEATRDVPGAPEIPARIREKIAKADMFIADITTVTTDANRKDNLPNPNVTFELGFAVAHLGWERVVLLYNTAVAQLERLPFDFDHNRISVFRVSPKEPTEKQTARLYALVEVAVETILIARPLRPRDEEGKSVEEVRHARDVATLTRMLGQISTGFIDQHTKSIPEHIFFSAPFTADILREAVVTLSLKLHDKRLEDLLARISKSLDKTLKFDRLYREMNSIGVQSISHINEPTIANRRKEDVERQQKANVKLMSAMAKFVELVHSDYPEIDLTKLDEAARGRYRKETKYNR